MRLSHKLLGWKMMEGKKFKLCHHWIGKTWRDEADMKVGLFHGQAAGPPRP